MPPANLINTEISHPWLPENQPPINADFRQRVVMLPSETHWQATGFDGLEIRILEFVPDEGDFRLTAQLRTRSAFARSSLYAHTGFEALVQAGELSDQNNVFPAGLYLRNPATDAHTNPAEQLHFGTAHSEGQDIDHGLLFLSLGQFATSDGETRRINTHDESKWLPGPEEGTEVMPLHMHGTSNSMMVRWTSAASFVPRLDPRGEEVLVLAGKLHDEKGQYDAGSWIRNPVEAWQSWSAEAGTLIYYKNGHFPEPAE